ncbi:uncharacterized protein si:dkeyp-118a3.2 isoform X2 [Austrofundulus limnaeus]|uniref:Uncharacterized protein si:dkeyp-118a3.2 isoform X2 n=1 Tax=Austrofundulus limnaeus TaxID=52670 RepID=A0A2I4AXY2_AUSLI|nr:PREDICTED: uncharacterized protein LOC106515203 isoform X2 [Austrofundulus limnaeus]
MRYSAFIGLLVVLLKQFCTSEGGSTPSQSSTEVTYQDGQNLSQDPELPAAEPMPVVSLPSLKEVQQAVKTASEQADSRGAGEVLKELLERVVEAALGHAERGGEAKDAVAKKETVNLDGHGVETGREVEKLEQPVLNKNTIFKEGDAGFEEEGEAEADAIEDVVMGEKRVVKGQGGTAAASMEKSTESVETEVREAEGLEDIDESLGTTVSQEVTEKASEKTKVELERREEDSKEQVVLSVLKNATETEIRDKEETPAAVEAVVDVQPEQEDVNDSKPGLGVAEDEQIGTNGGKEVLLNEETPTSETDGEITVLPSKHSEIKITKAVVGGPAEVEEGIKRGEFMEGHEKADEKRDLEAGGTEDKAETKVIYFRQATVDEINNISVIKEKSSVNMGGDNKGEEEQTTVKNLHHVNDQETLVIPGLHLEHSTKAFMGNRPEYQLPTLNPSADEVESEENTLSDEKFDHSNEIITPTDDFLPHKHGRIQPTLEHFQNDVLAEYHQAEGGEPREANELVEDSPGIRETDERGLEAWKIGAIFAAVFLVLETLVIIFYIVKCRNKKSTPAVQRLCEDGRVEAKAATGGNCSDDTLPAGNGSTQQTTTASTLARKREQQEDKHAVAMTKLSPRSDWELATSGPEPDPSQDLRTSV